MSNVHFPSVLSELKQGPLMRRRSLCHSFWGDVWDVWFWLVSGFGSRCRDSVPRGESGVLYKHVCQWMTGANYARMVWSSAWAHHERVCRMVCRFIVLYLCGKKSNRFCFSLELEGTLSIWSVVIQSELWPTQRRWLETTSPGQSQAARQFDCAMACWTSCGAARPMSQWFQCALYAIHSQFNFNLYI